MPPGDFSDLSASPQGFELPGPKPLACCAGGVQGTAWQLGPAAPNRTVYGGCAVLEDAMWVLGSQSRVPNESALSHIMVYNFTTETWGAEDPSEKV